MPTLAAVPPNHVTSSSSSHSMSQSSSSSAPRSASASHPPNSFVQTHAPQGTLDTEPNDEWKEEMKHSIQRNLQPMLQDAKDSLAKRIDENPQNKDALMAEHVNNTLPTIRRMAEETYQAELARERQERSWALGKNLPPASFVKQQQEIMDRIKSTNSAGTNSGVPIANIGTTSSASAGAQLHPRSDASGILSQSQPRAEPRPPISKHPVSFPVQEYPIPVLPPELEERRRASDLHGGASTKNRDEFLSSVRRPPMTSIDRDQRLPLPEGWIHSTPVVPTNDDPRPPSSSNSSIRSKPSLNEVRMSPSNPSPTKSSGLDRARTISERHLATSPSTGKSLHEIWKPSISPEEDAAASKQYPVGRRNSNASMRSIGSASSALRTSAAETIPERVNDIPGDEGSSADRKGKGKERMHFSAAAAAAATGASRPPSSGPLASTPFAKSPLADDHTSRERDHSNNFGPYATPQRSSRSSLSSLNGSEERERHPTPPSSATRVRDSDHDYRPDRRERPDFMNGAIVAPAYDQDDTPYSRPYHDRPNLPRSTSYTRPPPSLRDDNDRRDEHYHRGNIFPSSPSIPVPVPRRSSNSNAAYSADQNDPGAPSSLTGGVVGSWRDWSSSSQPYQSSFPIERDRDHDLEKDRERHERPAWQGSLRGRPPESYGGLYSASASVSVTRERERQRYSDEFGEDFDDSPFPSSANSRKKEEADAKKAEEVKRKEDELRKREEEVARKEDSVKRKEGDLKKKEGDLKKKESDAKRKEEELIRKEDRVGSREEFVEGRGKELDELGSCLEERDKGVEKREQDLARRETNVRKREETARKQTADMREEREELKKLQQEAKKVQDEARAKEEEVVKREEMVKDLETATKGLQSRVEEDEKLIEEREEDLKRKEEALKRREDDLKKKEDDAKKRMTEVKKKELESNRRGDDVSEREAALTEREVDFRRREDELRNREKEVRKREDELTILKEDLDEREGELVGRLEEARELEDELNRTKKTLDFREEEIKARANELTKRETAIFGTMKQKLEGEAEKEDEREWERYRERERGQRDREQRDREQREAREREQRDLWDQRQQEQREREQVERERREQWEREEKERAAKTKGERDKATKARDEREKVQERKEHEERLRRQQEADRQREIDDRERREERARHEWEEQQRKEKDMKDAREKEVKDAREREQRERDTRFKEEQERLRHQMEFQLREAELKRQREERKRQDSAGADHPWPGTSSSSPGPGPGRAPPTRANSTTASDGWNNSTSSSGWNTSSSSAWTSAKSTSASSTTSSTTPRPKPAPTPNPQRKPSMNTGSYASTPMSEAERRRKMEEETQKQHEKFRLEQERIATERQARMARGNLSTENMMQIYELHDRQWVMLPNRDELHWDHFPWPMFTLPRGPDDITGGAILAYLKPDCYPEKDKSRNLKDRIKDQIKKWHPDRFDTKLLPKVVESQKEFVKLGAGAVVRYLNDLLDKAPGLMGV
ncbi:hypothetical protein P691DRAFT_763619 [Macrolepiota fuliginosa MF-IS2]|uniref:Uncharacterized protein n=1 Tax=Macrolepiota fuliginosa MF-IS2 TaxID=1400762 RepID=A0A9P5X417_9AGAR|nr:hypothetical protein P691DRAFT_763619 [Macrolepiota fuliginosa MF-IS2]